jgi:hypothetical protein
MKKYVVGILSMFENNLKLFKIEAENEYEAVKKGMIDFNETEESKQFEKDWQNSDDYPKDYEGLYSVYEEVPFSVVEVGSFVPIERVNVPIEHADSDTIANAYAFNNNNQ